MSNIIIDKIPSRSNRKWPKVVNQTIGNILICIPSHAMSISLHLKFRMLSCLYHKVKLKLSEWNIMQKKATHWICDMQNRSGALPSPWQSYKWYDSMPIQYTGFILRKRLCAVYTRLKQLCYRLPGMQNSLVECLLILISEECNKCRHLWGVH